MLSNQVQGLLLHYPEGGLKVEVSQGNQSEMFPLFWWVINPFSLSAHLCSGDFFKCRLIFLLKENWFCLKVDQTRASTLEQSWCLRVEAGGGKEREKTAELILTSIFHYWQPCSDGRGEIESCSFLKKQEKKNRKWSSTKAWLLPEKDQNTSSDYEFIWIY